MSLRRRCPEMQITIWGRNQMTLNEVRAKGLADAVTIRSEEAVAGADLVLFSTPVDVMQGLAVSIAPHLESHAAITDAGSVKSSVVEKLTGTLGNRFVGAHPMAGSERSGLGAAREDLFSGSPCILTPLTTSDPLAVEIVTWFWSSLGSLVSVMTPSEHDRIVARLSHLPHVLAYSLVNLAASTLPEGSSLLAGGSYRDGTRVASSNPGLWAGILMENRAEVATAVNDMATALFSIAGMLEKGDAHSILDLLTRAKNHQDSMPAPLSRPST